jgi:hypothetical protein
LQKAKYKTNEKTMKIKDFKSGHWKQQYQYKSFSPTKINCSWMLDDEKLNFMLSRANILLGELNAYKLFYTTPYYISVSM